MYPQFYGNSAKNLHYPDNWRMLAAEIKAACGYVCQECDKQCRRPGELYLGPRYELTVSHYDGDYDSEIIFVVALCAVCHLRHDAPHSWRARRRHAHIRRLLAGQLELQYPSIVSIHV